MGYGCEIGAKSSTLASMIPEAEATGNCEIRPLSTVVRIETNAAGRVTEVVYYDEQGETQAQRAKAVVLCANGAETPRLLFLSESSRFPNGLANSSGALGKYLMFNGNATVSGSFEHPLNEYKSAQVTRLIMKDFYHSDPARGFYGGGALDGRVRNRTGTVCARRTPTRGADLGSRIQSGPSSTSTPERWTSFVTVRRCRWRPTVSRWTQVQPTTGADPPFG